MPGLDFIFYFALAYIQMRMVICNPLNSIILIYQIYSNQIKTSMPSRLLALLLLFLAIGGTQCISDMQIPLGYDGQTHIDRQVLMNKVAPILKTTYLSIVQEEILPEYKGIIYSKDLAMINLPVGLVSKSCPASINVIFVVITGSAVTTLAREVLQKLYDGCPQIQPIFSDSYSVKILGRQVQVQESKAHYREINIFGTDLLGLINARLQLDYLASELGHFQLIIQGPKAKKQADEL